jgi:hypothetical protein
VPTNGTSTGTGDTVQKKRTFANLFTTLRNVGAKKKDTEQ